MMRGSGRAAILLAAVLALIPMPASARQTRLVEPRSVSVAPSLKQWSFSTPFDTDSLEVTRVQQLSFPFRLSFSPLRDWRLEVSSGLTRGSVNASERGGPEKTLSLDGLTDTKVRAVGRLLGERLWLTLGLNLPTGHDRLTDEEIRAVRVLGAPALRMTTPVLGSGTGVIVGPVYTAVLGEWAVGLGASYEMRGSYSPLEASLLGGGSALADLDPAEAFHLSLGLDRLVGGGRMSFLFAGDRYGTDRITIRSSSGEPAASTRYQLGPTASVLWQYQLATQRMRELRFSASARYRSRYKTSSGDAVEGSDGTFLDGGVRAVIGSAGSTGLVLGITGSMDSGLSVDETVATAAMTSIELTVGIDLPVGRRTVQPFVRGSVVRLDAASGQRTGRGFGAGLILATVW